MKKIALLDIGTNSIKFNISEIGEKDIQTITDTNNISRLGEGLNSSGRISNESMARNLEAIDDFVRQAVEAGVEEIKAVGTMCLRRAANADEFINKVKEKSDVDIRVLSGEEEAYFSHLAITRSLSLASDEVIVIDSGGGSTEFIYSEKDRIEKKFSLDLGALHPTEKYLLHDPVTEGEYQSARKFIKDYLIEAGIRQSSGALVGIGGTMTSLAAIHHQMAKYDPDIVHGSMLKAEDIESISRMVQKKTIAERREITGLQPKRAEVILGGSLIIAMIMEILGKSEITVSDRGLRHGILIAIQRGEI